MPHINRIRVNNVKYNFGTQYYDDFVMRFSGKNTIYDLANGGGKSVLMLLLLQNLIPNCTLDEKQPIEKLFRSGNGNTTIHSMIEWKLNPCHVKNGFQYMTTGFCARKARGASGEDGEVSSDRASIDYFNYCIFYRQFNDNDLKNLPLSNGKERITYLGLRSYLQELEKKDFHVEVKIFDRKGDYQRFISQYGLFESEWEIIRGINKTEGHVRTYFETNYRTTRKVVEDLLIEEIIEKSFYHKTGTDREAGEMANTLLDLKDQLVLLSQKKNEIHYYDRQIALLSEFAARVGSLSGMYLKKQGLEEQLVKTYNTTLKRRAQKEHAHEELTENSGLLVQQKQEISRQIDTAAIQKKEQQLAMLEEQLAEKEKSIEEVSEINEKKLTQLEQRECDNYYLNYLEFEKEYLAAKQAVEEILSGSDTLEDDLFAMANELKQYAEQEQKNLAEIISELQEQSESLEEEKTELEKEEKALAIKLEVLEGSTEKLENERQELAEKIHELSQKESVLFFSDMRGQCDKAEREYIALQKKQKQTSLLSEQCTKELYGAEYQNRTLQKEERRIATELEILSQELGKHTKLKDRMEQLIGIYGGTYESVENILFQQQKELVLAHQAHVEEKKRLQAKLSALADGIFVPQPEKIAVFLEDVARYYDEKAVSGYDYLREKPAELREFLQERYPMLPYAVVTSASLESIAADRKFKEKDFGDILIPVISLQALEREKELADENSMIFAGKIVEKEKVKERLSQLETIFAKEYERERILKQDYNFVQMFLQHCADYETKQNVYDSQKSQWKQLQSEREEMAAKMRMLGEQEETFKAQLEKIEQDLKEAKVHLENMQLLYQLEKKQNSLNDEVTAARKKAAGVKDTLAGIHTATRTIGETLDRIYHSLDTRRQELKRILESWDTFKNYVNDREYPATGLEKKALEVAFLGKKAAYEQKNTDISDKQKLMDSYEKSMEQQKQQLQLLGHHLEEMAEKQAVSGCVKTDMEQMLVLKKEVFDIKNQLVLLEKEKKSLEERLHKTMGSIQHAKQMAEEKYGEVVFLEVPTEQLEIFVVRQKEQLKALEAEMSAGQKKLRELEEQCYALKAMAQDMERMMKSAGITPEHISECLETGMSLKEQYEELRLAYETIVKEESKRLEAVEKEKQLLTATLEKMGAYELSHEIQKNLNSPENEIQIKEQMDALRDVTECLELEKNRISKDMDSLQELKDQFEAQCLQNCLNIKAELDRLQKLSRISMDQQMISMITLQVPYIKEELYGSAMSEYIDQIIRQVENFDSQPERLNFIRNQLAFKRLFSVIVTNMDAIKLTLYKRERMKEQSRYLKYEEAVGSTGQSQGIYIQFLVAIINYISSINSGNADPLDLKKVIFIDNPFGAAKDVYIWEPIFKLLKSNNVQLVVPARGATPAITGHFEVNYILGQKLIDGRVQTVVVDYRSQTEEKELEYAALEYEQESFSFL